MWVGTESAHRLNQVIVCDSEHTVVGVFGVVVLCKRKVEPALEPVAVAPAGDILIRSVAKPGGIGF